jgi:hypothetical protein
VSVLKKGAEQQKAIGGKHLEDTEAIHCQVVESSCPYFGSNARLSEAQRRAFGGNGFSFCSRRTITLLQDVVCKNPTYSTAFCQSKFKDLTSLTFWNYPLSSNGYHGMEISCM